MSEQGKLIVFEGIDGSGKTTLMRRVYEQLVGDGNTKVIQYALPTKGPIGNKALLFLPRHDIGDEINRLVLFIVDIYDWAHDDLKTWLDKGYTVLLDRYYFSTMVYQEMPQFNMFQIQNLCENLLEFPKPDLLIFVDLSPSEAIERVMKRDSLSEDDWYKVYDELELRDVNYRVMLKTYLGKLVVVPNMDLEEETRIVVDTIGRL